MNTCPSTSTAAHQQLCEHLYEQLHEHLLGTSCSLINVCLEGEGGMPAPSLAATLGALALLSSPLVPEQCVAQGAGTGRVNGTRWASRGGLWERGQGLGPAMVPQQEWGFQKVLHFFLDPVRGQPRMGCAGGKGEGPQVGSSLRHTSITRQPTWGKRLAGPRQGWPRISTSRGTRGVGVAPRRPLGSVRGMSAAPTATGCH